MTKIISRDIASKMIRLSNLEVDEREIVYFTDQFNETLKTIAELNELNTKSIPATSHVTGLVNVFREDVADEERMLSQNEALSNAKRTHNGYFVVKAIFT